MRTQQDTWGNPLFIPKSIIERRGMTTGQRLFDEENGILASQKAKYEKPNWAFVSGLLVGCDKAPDGALTCSQMSSKLESHGIFLKPHAIYAIIQQMKRPYKAIHRHNRRIGQSCKEIVLQMGGICERVTEVVTNGTKYPAQAYYFGNQHDEVLRLRRAFELIVRTNP